MKSLKLYLIVVVSSACLWVNGQELSSSKQTQRELRGWGNAFDPDHDCKFFLAEDALLISVPGFRPHDLAADIDTINAPRVLQSVDGDFTMQVKVEGRFTPGDQSTKEGRAAYNGAAIVALVDPKNVVTLARAVLQRPDAEAQHYANFEIRVAGDLQRFGLTTDHPLPKDGPVFLRLERRGSQVLGAVSTDGITWDELEPKDIPAEWPKTLQAGVAAISTSKDEFNPRFSKFQILK